MSKSRIFETVRASDISAIRQNPFFFYKKLLGYPQITCAYQAYIIQNLDVLIFELDMKVFDIWKYYFKITNYAKFYNFWQTGHTKRIFQFTIAYFMYSKTWIVVLLIELLCTTLWHRNIYTEITLKCNNTHSGNLL